MKILFVHQNFPAQYLHIARFLGAQPDNEVVFITQRTDAALPGVRNIAYKPQRQVTRNMHHYLRESEAAVLNAQMVARVALELKDSGFVPDVLMQSLGIRRINLHKISPRGNAIDAVDLAVGPTAWRNLVANLEARSHRRGQSANTRIRYELLHCTSSEYDQLVLSGVYAPLAASSFYSQTGGQRIVLYPDGRIYISSEAFGTESHVGSIKNGEFAFNELSTNEFSLFNSTRNAFRVHMINDRLEGDERFPIVLSVSYRREAYV